MSKPVQLDANEKGLITARIVDSKKGLVEIHEVHAIRIHDKRLYSLIMNDYLPTMGKINGEIIFIRNDGETRYGNIQGFYKHHHNEFTLVIERYTK